MDRSRELPWEWESWRWQRRIYLSPWMLHKVASPIQDDLEEMEPVEMTVEEVEQKLLQGEVKVQGWIAVTAMGLLYLKKKHSPRFDDIRRITFRNKI